MKKFPSAVAAVMLAAVSYSSLPAQAQPAPPAAAEPKSADDNKVICKADNPTGTRVSTKKTCKTKAEWAEFIRQQREETQRVQNNALDQRIQSGN